MGIFDDITKESQGASGGLFDSIVAEAAKPKDGGSYLRHAVGDPAVALAKGVVGLPEAAAGLVDLATDVAPSTLFSRGVKAVAGAKSPRDAFTRYWNDDSGGQLGRGLKRLGVDFKASKAAIDTLLTPEQQADNKAVSEAGGFLASLIESVKRPGTIAGAAAESAPSMLGGAGIARKILAVAPTVAPLVAAAIGEGMMGGGSAQEQTRKATGGTTFKQTAAGVASGSATALLSLLGGRLAKRIGIDDVDTWAASGRLAKAEGDKVRKALLTRVVEGVVSEGAFEEAPQSAVEQMMANIAGDRPVMQGVGAAGAQGLLTGGAMGGGANVAGWVASNPAEAKALASKPHPSRKDFEEAGLPRMPAEERAAFAEEVAAQLEPRMPDPSLVLDDGTAFGPGETVPKGTYEVGGQQVMLDADEPVEAVRAAIEEQTAPPEATEPPLDAPVEEPVVETPPQAETAAAVEPAAAEEAQPPVVAEEPPPVASDATPTIESFGKEPPGRFWYQGTASDGSSSWVTSNLEKALQYAKRHPKAKLNVFTAEQVGDGAFADKDGNAMSPEQYAKTQSTDTTIQTLGSGGVLPEPTYSFPLEQTAPAAELPPTKNKGVKVAKSDSEVEFRSLIGDTPADVVRNNHLEELNHELPKNLEGWEVKQEDNGTWSVYGNDGFKEISGEKSRDDAIVAAAPPLGNKDAKNLRAVINRQPTSEARQAVLDKWKSENPDAVTEIARLAAELKLNHDPLSLDADGWKLMGLTVEPLGPTSPSVMMPSKKIGRRGVKKAKPADDIKKIDENYAETQFADNLPVDADRIDGANLKLPDGYHPVGVRYVHISDRANSPLAERIESRKNIPTDAIDGRGIDLPEGYVKNGNEYVFETPPVHPEAEVSPASTPVETKVDAETAATEPTESKSEDANTRDNQIQLLEDTISTNKEMGRPVQQSHLDRLAELKAERDGKTPAESGDIASDNTVFGHPESTSNPQYANLVPIRVSDADAVERFAKRAQAEVDRLQAKRGTADAQVKGRISATAKEKKAAEAYLRSQNGAEDELALERLRAETLPELRRLTRELESRQPAAPVAPEAAESREPWQMTASEYQGAQITEMEQLHSETVAKNGKLGGWNEVVDERDGRVKDAKRGMKELEALKASDTIDPIYSTMHRGLVQRAIAAGKPVPAAVLADYPDLAAKAEPTTPAVKIKPLRMDGTTRPEKSKSKGLATLPEKSVKMMDDAIAAKDVETLTTKGMLDTKNKAWRAQFEERTGVKLPKTQRETREVVAAWAKQSTPATDAKGRTPERVAELKKLAKAPQPADKPLFPTVKVETQPDGDKVISVPSKDKPGVPPKQQKAYLLAELDKAIEGASDEDVSFVNQKVSRFESADQAIARARNQRAEFDALAEKIGKVTIEVPGDGTFELLNSKRAIQRFKESAAKKFPLKVAADSKGAPSNPSNIAAVPKSRPSSQSDMEKIIAPMVSQDETRQLIMQTHVDGENKAMVATDGKRMAVILDAPFKTTEHVINVVEKDKKGNVTSRKKVEASYPNWTQVVPGGYNGKMPGKDMDNRASVDTTEFSRKVIQAIASVESLAGQRDVAPLISVYLSSEGKIEIATSRDDNMDGDRRDDKVVAGYESADISNATLMGTYNAQHILDAMSFFRRLGNESVEFSSNNQTTPAVITGAREFYVIMPMTIGGKVLALNVRDGEKPTPAALPQGVGAASAKSSTEFFDGTGVSHAYTETMRRRWGMEARMPHEVVADEERLAEMNAMLAKNANAGRDLMDALLLDPERVPNAAESILLERETVIAETEFNNARSASIGLKGEQAVKENNARMDVAEARVKQIYGILERAGSAAGAALRARRFIMNDMYQLARMEFAVERSQDGKALSKDQKDEIARLKAEWDRTKAELDGIIAQKVEANRKLETDLRQATAAVRYAEDVAALNSDPKRATPFRKKMLAAADRLEAEAMASMKARGARMSAGVDPTVFLDMGKLGAAYVIRGTVALADWTAKMRSVFADASDDDLEKARIEAMKLAQQEKSRLATADRAAATDEATAAGAEGGGVGIKALFRMEAESGAVATFDEALDNVTKIVNDNGVEMTREQVRDSYSDYDKPARKLNEDEARKLLSHWRNEAQLLGKIEDVQNQIEPHKIGAPKYEKSQRGRELQKELNRLMKAAGFTARHTEEQIAGALDAVKTRLRNAIADLDKAIAENKRMVSEGRKGVEYDSEAKALQAVRDQRQAQYDEIFKPEALSDEQRLQVAIKQQEHNLARWQRRVSDARSGKFDREAPAALPYSQRMADLKAGIEAAKVEIETLREAAQPGQRSIDAKRKRIEANTKEMERRIREKDFAPRSVKEIDISKDAKAMAALSEHAEVRHRFEALKEEARRSTRTPRQVVQEYALAGMDAQRNILASFDFSAVGRQGWYPFLSHPIMGMRNTVKMFQAMSRGNSAAIAQSIRERDNYKNGVYQRAKLALTEDDGTGNFTHVEDRFRLDLVDRVPGIKMSNRTYATFLNLMRADIFDAMLANSKDPGDTNTEKIKALATGIGILSGRGELQLFGRKIDPESMAHFVWAPRFMQAAFDILTVKPLRTGTLESRVIFGKEYIRAAASLTLIYAVASMFGGDDREIEWDPRSSDFGAIKWGDYKINPIGFIRPYLVFMARNITGVTKTERGITKLRETGLIAAGEAPKEVGYGKGMDQVWLRFAQSKAHPTIGTAFSFATGKDFGGEPRTNKGTVKDMTFPLSLREMYQAMSIADPDAAVVLSMMTLMGMQVNPDYNSPEYMRFENKDDAAFMAAAGKRLYGATSESAESSDKVRAARLVADMGIDAALEALKADVKERGGKTAIRYDNGNLTPYGERRLRLRKLAAENK